MKKILLLTIFMTVASESVYAWGSDVTYKDMPNSMNVVNPFSPEAIVVNPSGASQDPNSYNKFTPTGRNNTGDLPNGWYDVYIFRSPHTLSKVCSYQVNDWNSGAAGSQTHHYCIHAYGACKIWAPNTAGSFQLFLRDLAGQDIQTSAGNCSEGD